MNSRIYTGHVMHARRNPIVHRWVFPFYFYAIDLDELPEIDHSVRGFGFNRWKPVCLREQDYLRGSGPFREQLSEFIDISEVEQVILVTVARFLTRTFNPVSFYYCLRSDDTPVCMVAEVNNTFGERHLYLLDGGDAFPLRCRHDKQFHVSPFNSMDGHYEFLFSMPGDNLNIEIRLMRNDEVVMDAAMRGAGKPLTTGNLWRTIIRYPFTAGLTMPRIIWQAALLHYKKKLPIFHKPAPISSMTIKENA